MTFHMSDAALGIILLLVLWSFYRAQRDPANNFNLFDLIMENGRVSRIGFAYLIGLLVTSWVLTRMALNKQNIDIVFSAYLASWVAPIVAKLFSPPQATTSTQTSTSTVTTTPTKVEEKHEP